MKRLRFFLFLICIISALFAVYLSFEVDYQYNSNGSVSLDSAKDGGALGFAILSGLALVALSITYLKENQT